MEILTETEFMTGPLRIIDLREPGSDEQLSLLRQQLSLRGDVVSPSGRQKTRQVFGEVISPTEVVRRICENVRERGWPAVCDYTLAFDEVQLERDTFCVHPSEFARAHAQADPEFLTAIRRVRSQIQLFQQSILHASVVVDTSRGVRIEQRYRPIRRVGICLPGGAAAYPSTLLMTVVPAQVAGVSEIAVVAPPTPFGADNPDILAVCHELGVQELYRVGGAQAVAALAFGTDELPRVDLIVGPGNLFVALAKRYVFGDVGIDSIAGPSEIVILADDSAPAKFVAADLLAQAEHSPGASLLVTWDSELATKVLTEIKKMSQHLSRGELALRSLEEFGAILMVHDEAQAIAVTNLLAPEHLQIATRSPAEIARHIETAGAIFLGHYSPVALGDYLAGPSHVLPTGGSGRWTSGLSANTFLRGHAVIEYTPEAVRADGATLELLAHREQLPAHATSVRLRNQTESVR